MVELLEVTYRIQTPLFLGGVDPHQAEMRVPSIKGALRFWYRAVDPAYTRMEEDLFGSAQAGKGQSRFLIRMETSSLKSDVIRKKDKQMLEKLKKLSYLSFFLTPNSKEKKASLTPHSGKKKKKGSRTPNSEEEQGRGYLAPKQDLKFSIVLRPPVKGEENPPEAWHSVLASVWLLGHIGGLGSRSRRGFGTVALKSWKLTGNDQADQWLRELPIAHGAESMEKWYQRWLEGLSRIQSWFGDVSKADHTVIDRQASFFYGAQGYGCWDQALFEAAKDLKYFRKEPSHSCDRIALGLPMISQKRHEPEIEYKPIDFERVASPVWIRVVQAGDKFYPVFAILSAPYPSQVETKREGKRIGKFPAPDVSLILRQFADHLRQRQYQGEGGQ